MAKLIAIAGNIGSGKTSLARLLARELDWIPALEEATTNPYINDFYDEMGRWSFNMQIHYLKERFNQVIYNREENKKTTIQDRTIYEDVYVFAPSLHDMRLISNRDLKTYLELFKLIDSLIQPPDLLIYLRSKIPNLLSQIQKRGRKFESQISSEYLQRLNERYEAWIHDYENKHIIIDIESSNFVDNPKILKSIAKDIERKLA